MDFMQHKLVDVTLGGSPIPKAVGGVVLTALGLAAVSCTHDADDTPPPPVAAIDVGSATEVDNTGGSASIILNGSGAGAGGTYSWSLMDKPSGAAVPTLAGADTATLTVSNFNKLGNYEFKLTAKNSAGVENTATVTINVYRMATTTLNIDANSFSSTPGTWLDFAPSYSSVTNSSDFSTSNINSCLTYTIEVVNHDGSYTPTLNSTDVGFDGKITPRSEYGTDLATFTQTFYNNGVVKGTPRVLKAMVSGGIFRYFGDSYAGSDSVPAITGISISRKITSE